MDILYEIYNLDYKTKTKTEPKINTIKLKKNDPMCDKKLYYDLYLGCLKYNDMRNKSEPPMPCEHFIEDFIKFCN
jgi:hypothetical protein